MSGFLIWTGFFLGLAALLTVSKKNFAVAMFLGAFVLAIFSIRPIGGIITSFVSAFTDLATVLLALAVGLIPIIGATLKETGQMDNLIENMRIGKKAFLAVSPALLGMLPMPGGALLSAPMVEKGGKEVLSEKKCALNVWFRHILFLIYPLSPAMIVSVKIAELNIYDVILYLTPFFLFSVFLGYFFFLRGIEGKTSYDQSLSLKRLLLPLTVILVAPVMDFFIKTFFPFFMAEAATLIGITTSLVLAIIIGRVNAREFSKIAWKSKPWDFAFIILGMTVFLNVFKNSGIPTLIQTLQITPVLLCGVIAFLLGFATGRMQTPALIIIPIFLTKFGILSAPVFATMFFSIFLGYVLSPVHPCVSLSTKFFHMEIKDSLKAISPPAFIGLIVSCILFLIIT
jgi:integral membrane protein (TIGR00529 family)